MGNVAPHQRDRRAPRYYRDAPGVLGGGLVALGAGLVALGAAWCRLVARGGAWWRVVSLGGA
jgi:hypothetical protein